MVKRIGIIGLGTVGESAIRSLKRYASLIRKRTSLKIEIVRVCDTNRAKRSVAKKYSLKFASDPFQIINDPAIDIVLELIGGIHPAKEYIVGSLKKGKDVVTANKALLAECGQELFSLAARRKKNIGFEGSVCGAIPLIKSISEGLVGCEVNDIYAILNGTTNYILDRMHRQKMQFRDALEEAQCRGFAERNPSLDIEGKDALHKLCILAYLCFGVWPSFKKVYVEGIGKISLLDVLYAEEMDFRIKLLAIAKREKSGLDLRVHPTLIPYDHPLSEVHSSFNAIFLNTCPAGELLFYGKGAGGVATSSSIMSDIVNVSLRGGHFSRSIEDVKLKNMRSRTSRYYIRFMAQDKPGVLAKIAKFLASYHISIASVNQKARGRNKFVPIVIVTHEAREDRLRKALAQIDRLSMIKAPSQVIRIEDL